MTPNIGNTDRTIRMLIAIALFAVYFSGINRMLHMPILLFAGIALMFTNFTGFCPLHWILAYSRSHKPARADH